MFFIWPEQKGIVLLSHKKVSLADRLVNNWDLFDFKVFNNTSTCPVAQKLGVQFEDLQTVRVRTKILTGDYRAPPDILTEYK